MPRLLAVLLLCLMGATAQAAVVSERPDHVAVTIYHLEMIPTHDLIAGYVSPDGGLSMISETRTVDLPEGVSDIQFRGVAATVVPQTADLDGLEEAGVERNFDYDLLSPAALLQKAIGDTVRVVRTNPKTGATTEENAVVLSGPAGPVLKIGERYEALKCNDLPGKLVFDRIPDGLIDQPTLTIQVKTRRAGRYTLNLRYVATGFNWSADYVARMRPDGKSLDLSGWLTLANFSESGFPAADVDVIAGHVETTGEDQPTAVAIPDVDPPCLAENAVFKRLPPPEREEEGFYFAGGGDVEAVTVSASRITPRDMGDYKQYPLPQPTDVLAQQIKQVQFLDQPAVPFERVYVCRDQNDDWRAGETLVAGVVLRLRNTEQQGLGKPLPAGGVTTTIATDGEPLLADQGTLKDTPVGLPVEIPAGEAADVVAEAREIENHRTGPEDNRRRLHVIEVTMTNQKRTAVSFEWHQAVYEAKVTAETVRHELKDGEFSWSARLAPGESRVLRYTLDEPD